MADAFLPVAGPTPPSTITSSPGAAIEAAVSELAAALTDDTQPTNLRFGVVTAVESTGNRRVQTNISGTGWLSRDSDTSLKVGDRVWIVQQGAVMLIGGRITGTDAFLPIGALVPFAGASAPTGFLICDGAAVSRTTYAALFAVVGTTYGAGNGTTTFNIPNAVNRIPVGSGGSYTRGQTGGAATVTLSDAQMPSHDHSLSGTTSSDSHSHGISGSTTSAGGHDHSVGNQGGRSDLLAGGGTSAATSGGGTTSSDGSHSHGISASIGSDTHSHTLSGTSGTAGSDAAHENMPPFIAMPYIIRAI